MDMGCNHTLFFWHGSIWFELVTCHLCSLPDLLSCSTRHQCSISLLNYLLEQKSYAIYLLWWYFNQTSWLTVLDEWDNGGNLLAEPITLHYVFTRIHSAFFVLHWTQGYVVEMPEKGDGDRKILTCSSCARAMRGRYRLKKLNTNVDFACAMGCGNVLHGFSVKFYC